MAQLRSDARDRAGRRDLGVRLRAPEGHGYEERTLDANGRCEEKTT